MKEIVEILNDLDWSPLWISIKTGFVATIISFFLGIYAARKVIKGKGSGRRNPDTSYGAAAYGSRIFPAAVIQQKKTGGNLFV